MIYFIQAETGGPIKIGYAENPVARLRGHQVSSPDPLRILAIAPGDMAEEKALHEHFEGHRVRGEWFSPDPEILAFIDEVKGLYPQELSRPYADTQDPAARRIHDELTAEFNDHVWALLRTLYGSDMAAAKAMANDASVNLKTAQNWIEGKNTPSLPAILNLGRSNRLIAHWFYASIDVMGWAKERGCSFSEAWDRRPHFLADHARAVL